MIRYRYTRGSLSFGFAAETEGAAHVRIAKFCSAMRIEDPFSGGGRLEQVEQVVPTAAELGR